MQTNDMMSVAHQPSVTVQSLSFITYWPFLFAKTNWKPEDIGLHHWSPSEYSLNTYGERKVQNKMRAILPIFVHHYDNYIRIRGLTGIEAEAFLR